MPQSGALPSQLIRQLVRVNQLIDTRGPYVETHVQPASADLTLSEWGYCVKAAFLPKPDETVEAAIKRYALFPVNLSQPQVLNTGSTYIFRLNERLALDPELFAYFSPKSSVGRLNVWVRTMADRVSRFDRVPRGYHGPLYVMITPKSWPVVIQAGLAVNQLRLFTGRQETLSRLELRLLHEELGLMNTASGERLAEPGFVEDGILLTADLTASPVAYRAKHSLEILDLTKEGSHDPLDFFDPIERAKNGELILRENEFYLLATYEAFRVPIDYCVEMVAYDVASGEFRSHYAGFFDPGFGFGDGNLAGTQATLEVIPHESVILHHRQPVCKMVFERLVTTPDKIYGSGKIGSHYQHQRGPGLSKYFTKKGSADSSLPRLNQPVEMGHQTAVADQAGVELTRSPQDSSVIELALKTDQVESTTSEPNRW